MTQEIKIKLLALVVLMLTVLTGWSLDETPQYIGGVLERV